VIDDQVIAYPYPNRTDLLIAMSREGYEKYRPELSDEGVLVFDEDMVDPAGDAITKHGVTAARIAEELGKRIVQNIVVVGYTTAATQIVSMDAARQSVEASVPQALLDLNLKAFEAGYARYQQ
jgi:2-oxoglutarate ferredoxin oxidoreductase subunit gamma